MKRERRRFKFPNWFQDEYVLVHLGWEFVIYHQNVWVIGYKVIVKNRAFENDVEFNYNFLTLQRAKDAVKRFISKNLKEC